MSRLETFLRPRAFVISSRVDFVVDLAARVFHKFLKKKRTFTRAQARGNLSAVFFFYYYYLRSVHTPRVTLVFFRIVTAPHHFAKRDEILRRVARVMETRNANHRLGGYVVREKPRDY